MILKQNEYSGFKDLFKPVNEDIKTILIASAAIIGVGALIGWAVYAGEKRRKAIEQMINDEFDIAEFKEIRKILL